MRKDIAEIKLALVGDASMGHVGLVSRVKSHSDRIKRLESLALYCSCASTLIAILWMAFGAELKTAVFSKEPTTKYQRYYGE